MTKATRCRCALEANPVFAVDQGAHFPEGSFKGLIDVVEGGDGKFALICFGGSLQVKIATFLLRTTGLDAPAELVSI